MFGVPGARHERDHGQERALGDADQEAAQHEAPGAGHGGHGDGDGGPGQHDARQDDARRVLGDDDVARDLADDVAHVEERDTRGPLHVGHVEVFLHAGEARVGDVDAVEVAGLR